MQVMRYAHALVALAALGMGTLVPAATKQDFAAASSADGLEKVTVKYADLAYARPGASLAGYAKVKLDPVQVAFRKDFSPERIGSHNKLTTAELEEIRSGVGGIVGEEFSKELARGSYAITETAGPDVLQVHADIVDLYVNAPDTMEPNRGNSFTMNAGEMTLVLSLADSSTGAVLARIYDRREAREIGILTWTTDLKNRADAAEVARSWARILRARLDAARGIGKK